MHIALFHFHTDKPNPVYQEIAAGLRKRDHLVWLGAPNRNGDLEWHDGTTVVTMLPGPKRAGHWLSRRWHYWQFMWRVRTFLRETAPDIVQINPTMMVWILTLWLQPKTHCVLDIRQINEAVDDRFKTKLKEIRDVLLLKANASFVFEHTCFCHQEAARRILGDRWARRSSVVPVGIDPHFLPHASQQTKDLSELRDPTNGTVPSHRGVNLTKEQHTVRFVYIGGLTRLRNLQNLLAAARRLKAQDLSFQLDLIGTDHSNRYYHDLVEEWAIQDVATVCDPVPYAQVPACLLQYDVGMAYVPDRPTWHYQPTIKVLEYRALGLPILSTNVATHREVVEAEVNGLLVADQVESIAEAMQRFITEPIFLATCYTNAQRMRSGITWDEIARMYDECVYQKLLNI